MGSPRVETKACEEGHGEKEAIALAGNFCGPQHRIGLGPADDAMFRGSSPHSVKLTRHCLVFRMHLINQ